MLGRALEVKAWFDDPEHRLYNDKFRTMTIKEFNEYTAREMSRKTVQVISQKKKTERSRSKSKRRRHENQNSEDEKYLRKRLRKEDYTYHRNSPPLQYDSEHLDDSS